MSTFIIAKENIAGSTLKELRLRRKWELIRLYKRGEIMVKLYQKMSACFLAMRFASYGCTGQRIQDLFASTRI
jgi:hypothetical protein